jgi:hypothetical protein
VTRRFLSGESSAQWSVELFFNFVQNSYGGILMNSKIKHVLKEHAYRNIPLSFDEGYNLGLLAIEGCQGNGLAMIQSVAALSALHTKATYGWTLGDESRYHEGNLPKNASE